MERFSNEYNDHRTKNKKCLLYLTEAFSDLALNNDIQTIKMDNINLAELLTDSSDVGNFFVAVARC